MSLIEKFIRGIKPRAPIIIETPYGNVTESARHAAAMNMRDDLDLRTRCEDTLINQMGGDVGKAMAEMRRRYPEAYL
jgi:hypothetical protein